MQLPVKDIVPLIPQKYPFVMISELIYADETTTRTSFLIAEENIFVDDDTFSEAGLMENMAQTAAAGAGYRATINHIAVVNGYIGAVKNFEVYALPKVNEHLITEVVIENQVFSVTMISGKVWCNDQLITQCEMNVYTGDKD